MQWVGGMRGGGEWKMEIVADKITELSAEEAAPPEAVAALQPQWQPNSATHPPNHPLFQHPCWLSSLQMLQRQNYACMCVRVCGASHVGWAEAPQGLNLKCQRHQRDLDNAVAAAATPPDLRLLPPSFPPSIPPLYGQQIALNSYSWQTTNPKNHPIHPNRLRVSQTKQWLALTIDMWCQRIFAYT